MNIDKKQEILQIAYRLAKDALYLYVLGGVGFLLAETILPGIFSQRINFFFLYAGYIALLIGVIVLGKVCGDTETQSDRMRNIWSVRTQIAGGIVGVFFLLPIMRNVPFWLALFVAVGSSTVCVLLARHLIEIKRKGL